jgi:hypothetical protein
MHVSIKFDDAEAQLEVLRGVADAYPLGSDEERAIRLAALALLHVTMNPSCGFAEFVQGHDQELTPAQREALSALGLDPGHRRQQ